MAVVIGVSVPEGLALLLGPTDWYQYIWGWALTPMTARFTSGVYLTVSLGFVMVWRDDTWESGRIPLAMLWLFALVALLSAVFLLATGNGGSSGPIIIVGRPFAWVWFFLYIVSVVGGFYYHLVHPKMLIKQGAART